MFVFGKYRTEEVKKGEEGEGENEKKNEGDVVAWAATPGRNVFLDETVITGGKGRVLPHEFGHILGLRDGQGEDGQFDGPPAGRGAARGSMHMGSQVRARTSKIVARHSILAGWVNYRLMPLPRVYRTAKMQ